MADTTTSILATDPFFSVLQNVQDVKTKVADSIFENYKLQVAQTADINNRAMQVALHDTGSLADLKAAVSKSTLDTMLSSARTDGQLGATAMGTQREIMHQGEFDRNLINGLNTQNLNTALINTNIGFSGLQGQYSGLGLAYGGAVSAWQSANQVSSVNALHSAVANQRFVNTGNATATSQTTSPTSIG
jgi:hypothetical protein